MMVLVVVWIVMVFVVVVWMVMVVVVVVVLVVVSTVLAGALIHVSAACETHSGIALQPTYTCVAMLYVAMLRVALQYYFSPLLYALLSVRIALTNKL